jgi:hypothetical protein
MRKRIASIMLSGGGAALAVCLSATAASAATWSISPAGSFTGSLNSGTTTQLKDTTTGVVLTCTTATAKGNVPKAGSGLPGKGIATVSAATFGSSTKKCTGPAGSTFTAVGTNLPWSLNAGSYNPNVDGGQTKGTLTASGTGVGGKLTGTVLGVSCSATFGGTTAAPAIAQFLYDNTPHLLAITGVTHLKVLSSNCPDVSPGDGATFVTSPVSKAGTAVSHGYSVSPPLKITSP